jgi:methionyl aminopeptidase
VADSPRACFMIILKSAAELDAMRHAGGIAGKVRDAVAAFISPGVTTRDISDYAGSLFERYGVKSAFLGYRGYPGQICVSVNEEVVHGIPGDRLIHLGDLVSLDVGVICEGFVGDTAKTILVGVIQPAVLKLVDTAEKALEAGIRMAVEGGRLSDISHAIEQTAVASGFSVVRDFVGHGVGRTLHEDPQIPNFGSPGRGPRLRAGMTLAIEPMLNIGTNVVDTLDDGWTVVTRDRKCSAHVEHTVAVTKEGPEVLTR